MKYGANLYDVIHNTWKNPWTVGQVLRLANPIFPKCHDLIIFKRFTGKAQRPMYELYQSITRIWIAVEVS